ncbi:MAG: CocE/NonD family hydrolase [Gammaproteobacteria bacterium]|nr:CocE/NonD family hydrolase [Gammaproteobacteria bacterium]
MINKKLLRNGISALLLSVFAIVAGCTKTPQENIADTEVDEDVTGTSAACESSSPDCFPETYEEVFAWLEENADIERMAMVAMRDDVRLATRVYLPKDTSQTIAGKFSTVFLRTPYNVSERGRDPEETASSVLNEAVNAIRHGYAFVLQNERGKYFSEGDWRILGYPRTDGYDALTWIAEQTWSDGAVGTLGCSSSAEWQLALGTTNHPALRAQIPQGYGAGIGHVDDFAEHGAFRGGAVLGIFTSWMYREQNLQRPRIPSNLSQEEQVRIAKFTDLTLRGPEVDWDEARLHLPMSEVIEKYDGPTGPYNDYILQGPGGPDWRSSGLMHQGEDYFVPTLWFGSWYDISVAPNLAIYNDIRNNASDEAVRESQYLVVGPQGHCGFSSALEKTSLMVGEVDMGDPSFPLDETIYDFLDYYVKGIDNGFADRTPKVQYYETGVNQWRQAEVWPPADVEEITFYLDSNSGANTRNGDGLLTRLSPEEGIGEDQDVFAYDPTDPVPTQGGMTNSPVDNSEVELRDDVLVYSTAILEEPLNVTGKMEAILYLSSDVPDTDLSVKLLDVYPDGRAMSIDSSIQRVRYREGYDQEVFMEEGEVYRVKVSPTATSTVFLAGHQLRIEISGSDFPRYSRNLNMGTNNFIETETQIANNVIHHSALYPSHIVIEVR